MKGKNLLTDVCRKSKLFLKENSAGILSVVGSVGVISTAVMAGKATPKALKLIEEVEDEKGEKLSKLETVCLVSPIYIPTVMMGLSTITCILGANYLNKQRQAALTSAYMMLDSSYKKYKNKVIELYGAEADTNVRNKIAVDDYEIEYHEPEEEKQLFYEPLSERYFESTIEEVQRAEYHLNRNFVLRDYANLNEFYKFLGLSETKEGEILGWSMFAGYSVHGYAWVDFTHDRVELDDGLECIVINYPFEPTLDFMDY